MSCAECRRSKLKCEWVMKAVSFVDRYHLAHSLCAGNREWPCSECLRRGEPKSQIDGVHAQLEIEGCASICPNGIMNTRPTVRQLLEENAALKRERERGSSRGATSPPDFLPLPGPSALPIAFPPAASSAHIAQPLMNQGAIIPPVPDLHIVGQLSLGSGGRSRFFGPTAAAHILPDEEDRDDGPPSRPSEPDPSHNRPLSFPFAGDKSTVLAEAQEALPTRDLLEKWCNVYWRASSWRFEPICREYLDMIILEVYASSDERRAARRGSQLAVLFSMLAVGCLFDEDLPPHSQQAQQFDSLALACLSADDFLTNTSVASL